MHDPKQLQAAEALVASGRSAEAEQLLASLARNMSPAWSAQRWDAGRLNIAFWSLPDFMDYIAHRPDEHVVWDTWSAACVVRFVEPRALLQSDHVPEAARGA